MKWLQQVLPNLTKRLVRVFESGFKYRNNIVDIDWVNMSFQSRYGERKNAKFNTVYGQCNNSTNPEAMYRKCGFTGSDIWHVLRKR